MSGAVHAVRVIRDGAPVAGRLEADTVVLDDGTRIPERDASFLAPVEPSKVVAVHLSYASRIEEYAARRPPQPSYFLKPPTTLNGHRGELRRPRGARFLNYEGELAVVIGRRMKGVGEDEALGYVAGYLQRLTGPDLQRVKEDVAALLAYAKQQGWAKQLQHFLTTFLADFGVGGESES